jgi:GNAT superfamily N-acetyltransferase
MNPTLTTTTDDPRLPAGAGAIEVRPPARDELPACRMLLPEAFRSGIRPDLLLAAGSSPRRYLGALAYDLVHHGGRLGWRLRLHVARAARRRGVGLRLIGEIAGRGRRRGAAFLAIEAGADDPAAAAFLAAAGFRVASRCSTYEGDLAHYRGVVAPIRDRLAARGRIPEGARVVGPREAPAEALGRLVEEWAARAFLPAADLSSGYWWRPSVRDASAILLLGDRAIGGVVAEARGEVAEIPWRSVEPEFRGGWANVVLAAGSADRLAALGVRRVRFATTEETPDTENGIRVHGSGRRVVVEHHRLDLIETRA